MKYTDIDQAQESISGLITQIHITMARFKIISVVDGVEIPGPPSKFKKELVSFFSQQFFTNDEIDSRVKIKTLKLMERIVNEISYDVFGSVIKTDGINISTSLVANYIKKMYFSILSSENEMQIEIHKHFIEK